MRGSSVYFRSQSLHANGAHMCTTACLHVAVAILSKFLDLSADSDDILQGKLNRIMHLASVAQGKMETGSNVPRMLSLHEILSECRISLHRLSLRLEEVFLVDEDSKTSCSASGDCFAEDRHLPNRLAAKCPSVGLATGSGHTVCVICYFQGDSKRYAFVDTLPGLLERNLQGEDLLHRMGAALRLQAGSCHEKKRSRLHVVPGNEHRCDVSILSRME